MTKPLVYKAHRLHTTQLPSGVWIVAVVNLGKPKKLTADSLTDHVLRIPGEHGSEERAVQAATHYIDQLEAQQQGPEH